MVRARYIKPLNDDSGTYTKFLDKRRKSFYADYVSSIAETEFLKLKKSIDDLGIRIDDFLQGDRTSEVDLVLGHVQSGKTGHMLGTLAWSADRGISLAVLISGSTKPLSSQTYERVLEDLVSVAPDSIYLSDQLETKRNQAKFNKQYQVIEEKVAQRINNEVKNSQLPIITVLKHAKRVESLNEVVKRLIDKFGTDLSVLVIDDEADQISQNGKAAKREQTEVYKQLKTLLESGAEVFMASYTATPQAILLAEKEGALRPRYVTVLKPGINYFGLEDATLERYSQNRHVVDPPDKDFLKKFETPKDLETALIQFFISSYIRRKYPESFFSSGEGESLLEVPKSISCQFLIHPSGAQIDHEKYSQLVTKCINRLLDVLNDPMSSSDALRLIWAPNYIVVLDKIKNIEAKSQLPPVLSSEMLQSISFSLGTKNTVKVVNSDKNRLNQELKLPSTNSGWESHETWILIGGDILGRGITFPTLLGTYFLRNPKNHKFDTAVQQLRFCGYRKNYQDLTSIWAPDEIFDLYSVMNQVNHAVVVRANKWADSSLDLITHPPAIMYVSPINSRLDPTRKSVMDPGIHDHRIKGNVVFQSVQPHKPIRVVKNAQSSAHLFGSYNFKNLKGSEWLYSDEISTKDAQNFLVNWEKAPGSDRANLARVSELLDENLGDLGFANVPITFVTRFIDVTSQLAKHEIPNSTRRLSNRSLKKPISNRLSSTQRISQWTDSFKNQGNEDGAAEWFDTEHMSAYVGTGQLNAQSAIPFSSVCILIEPISIHDEKAVEIVAYAMQLAVLGPKNYQLRMMGYSQR
jgi:hypothetical protein